VAGISLGTKLTLGQGLHITPQLRQAIELLQLSRLDLEQMVETQLAENPVLEEVSNDPADDLQVFEREATERDAVSERLESASSIVDKVSGDEKPDVDWDSLARYEESRNQASAGGQKNGLDDDETSNYENLATKSTSIQEHLMQQVAECDFDEAEKLIATVIVGNIDDRGYLSMGLDEICAQEKFDLEKAEGVLDTIQRFDPSGVGARSIEECLLIQLRFNRIKNPILELIITKHLGDLENRNFTAVSKALKLPVEKIFELVGVIAGLEPNPGRQFSPEATQFIIPDVYVFKAGQDWVVSMNEEGLPRLKISPFYKKMLQENDSKKSNSGEKPAEGSSAAAKVTEKEYLKDKIKTADWLIKSLNQRQNTIFRVMEKIVERQKEFFEYGVQYLRPMIRRDIATALGLHESTVSRATTNKFVHTPRGVYELGYFFNSGMNTGDGDVANEAIKSKLVDIVKAEDPKNPYSDQELVDLFEKENIPIARRTVAKYREQLNILPSSKRRKPF
jgi:RNA polymerase sigma-54 factor